MISKRGGNKIFQKSGQAIADFRLIQEGDNVLVAVSGGKDSLALLEVLLHLKRRAPITFTITACTIDEGFGGFDPEPVALYCHNKKVPFILKREKILQIIQKNKTPGSNFCSFCSRLRRGILYTLARERGFQKIALAHHADDFIETLILDLFYTGSGWKMPVHLVSKDKKNRVIRPLVYVYEKEIENFCSDQGISPFPHPCPWNEKETAKRFLVKQWLNELGRTNPAIKGNLLRAVLKDQPKIFQAESIKSTPSY